VPYVDDAARATMLADLRACVLDLDARPLLPLPEPRRLDATFAPLPSSSVSDRLACRDAAPNWRGAAWFWD
jgi:hypothetical protein